jgi:hypothetical protein
VNVAVLTDLTVSLNVAVTLAATATAVAFATGLVVFTVGRVVSVGGGGGGGGGVTAGLLLASPGKVLALISTILVDPSPSESAFSMAEKECPAPAKAFAYGLKVFVSPPGWQRLQLFSAVPDVPYVLLNVER